MDTNNNQNRVMFVEMMHGYEIYTFRKDMRHRGITVELFNQWFGLDGTTSIKKKVSCLLPT